jgi:hypothetical protein
MYQASVLSVVFQSYRTAVTRYKLALRSAKYSSGTKRFIGTLRHVHITSFIFSKYNIPPVITDSLGENRALFNIYGS